MVNDPNKDARSRAEHRAEVAGLEYLKLDGSRAMTGDLDMGSQAIMNVGALTVGGNATFNNPIQANDGMTITGQLDADGGLVVSTVFSAPGLVGTTDFADHAVTWDKILHNDDVLWDMDVGFSLGLKADDGSDYATINLTGDTAGFDLYVRNSLDAALAGIVANNAGLSVVGSQPFTVEPSATFENPVQFDDGMTVTGQLDADGGLVVATSFSAPGLVSTTDLDDDAVTFTKMEHRTEATVIGRQADTGTGPPVELTATNLKTILDYSGSDVTYDNAGSGLTATDVQSALDEIDGVVDSLVSGAPTVTTFDASGSATSNFPSGTNSGDKFILVNAHASGTTFGSSNAIVGHTDDILMATTDSPSTTDGSDWHKIDSTDSVSSVAGRTGAVVLAASDIVSGTFDSSRLAADSVTASQIAAGAVGNSELAADAVTNTEILNDTITLGKLALQDAWTVVGNATGVSANPSAVTATQLLSVINQGTGSFDDDLIAESSVTQHEAALSIATSQLTGTIDADTLGGQNSAYHLAWSNTTGAPIQDSHYTSLTGSSNDWFKLFAFSDSDDVPITVQLRAFAHTSATVVVSKGYQATQPNITVLSNVLSANVAYAALKGVRLVDNGGSYDFEIQLGWSSGPTVDVELQTTTTRGTVSHVGSLTATSGSPTVMDSVDLTALGAGGIRATGSIWSDSDEVYHEGNLGGSEIAALLDDETGWLSTAEIASSAVTSAKLDLGMNPTWTGNHTFSNVQYLTTGFQLGAGSARVYFGEAASGDRFYVAPRLADDSNWDWASEFGFDRDNDRWYFDTTVLFDGSTTFNNPLTVNDGITATGQIDADGGLVVATSFSAPGMVDASDLDLTDAYTWTGLHNFNAKAEIRGDGTQQLLVTNIDDTGEEAEVEIRGHRNSPSTGTEMAYLTLSNYDHDDTTTDIMAQFVARGGSSGGTDIPDPEIVIRARKSSAMYDALIFEAGTATFADAVTIAGDATFQNPAYAEDGLTVTNTLEADGGLTVATSFSAPDLVDATDLDLSDAYDWTGQHSFTQFVTSTVTNTSWAYRFVHNGQTSGLYRDNDSGYLFLRDSSGGTAVQLSGDGSSSTFSNQLNVNGALVANGTLTANSSSGFYGTTTIGNAATDELALTSYIEIQDGRKVGVNLLTRLPIEGGIASGWASFPCLRFKTLESVETYDGSTWNAQTASSYEFLLTNWRHHGTSTNFTHDGSDRGIRMVVNNGYDMPSLWLAAVSAKGNDILLTVEKGSSATGPWTAEFTQADIGSGWPMTASYWHYTTQTGGDNWLRITIEVTWNTTNSVNLYGVQAFATYGIQDNGDPWEDRPRPDRPIPRRPGGRRRHAHGGRRTHGSSVMLRSRTRRMRTTASLSRTPSKRTEG